MEFNKSKNLNLLRNPYLVKYSKRVKQAIEYALERNLLKDYNINPSKITHYFNKKQALPIWIIEAACNVNLKDIKIPAQYQYLWFCLHDTILTRKQPSGRQFKTKVNFTPCYVRLDNKLIKLLNQAQKIMNLPMYKFINLWGCKKTDNKKTISLLALLKICQILKINIWNLLENYELFSKSRREGKIVIPSNNPDVNLIILLIWLRTEGHIELGSTHIEINQKDNLNSLKEIEKLFTKIFNLKNIQSIFPKGKRGEDRLILSSSPLKQLLCLKYDFPLGYKSGSLQQIKFQGLSKEDYRKLMAAFIQTEGSLSYHYTRNKKKKLPRFEFIVKDEALANDCLITLKILGFNPRISYNQNLFKVALYNSIEVIDLVHQTKKYVFDIKKIKYLKKVCSNGIGL